MDCESVQYTNDEATANKAYAVRLGYWTDPYIKYFCPLPTSSTPEISRGYFVRVQTFEAIVSRFIRDCDKSCQIVNIGAGSDTLFFRLKDRDLLPTAYVEIDLPGNIKKKIFTLRRNKILQSALAAGDSAFSSPSIPTDRAAFGCYHILSFDLQSDPRFLIKLLCESPDGPQLSSDLPTLFLAECVLVYIPTKSSNALLSTLSSKFSQAAFLNYEQVSELFFLSLQSNDLERALTWIFLRLICWISSERLCEIISAINHVNCQVLMHAVLWKIRLLGAFFIFKFKHFAKHIPRPTWKKGAFQLLFWERMGDLLPLFEKLL